MNRWPSLSALRAFEAAARHGRMARAAEELHVTPGAVSRQIATLEADLGVSLFEGARRSPTLTAEGERLGRALSAAFRSIETAVEDLRGHAGGQVTVSCLGTFMLRWLIPRLHRFREAHPGIEVRLSESDAPVDFGRDRADLAIRVGTGPWPARVTVLPLLAEWTGVVLAPRLISEASEIAEAALDLPRLRSRSWPDAWPDWLAAAGFDGRQDRFAGPDYEHLYFMLEAAVAGLGATVAPEPLVRDDLRAGRLAAPFGFRPNGRHYVALLPETPRRSARVFAGWLRDEAAADDAGRRFDDASAPDQPRSS